MVNDKDGADRIMKKFIKLIFFLIMNYKKEFEIKLLKNYKKMKIKMKMIQTQLFTFLLRM